MASTATTRGSTPPARSARPQPSPTSLPPSSTGRRARAQVLRDAKKQNPAVSADEEQIRLFLVAHDLALKKMYGNVACLGGGPMYCTEYEGEKVVPVGTAAQKANQGRYV